MAEKKRLKLLSIEPEEQYYFGYWVTFGFGNDDEAYVRVRVLVAFTHGKREHAPWLGDIEKRARADAVILMKELVSP